MSTGQAKIALIGFDGERHRSAESAFLLAAQITKGHIVTGTLKNDGDTIKHVETKPRILLKAGERNTRIATIPNSQVGRFISLTAEPFTEANKDVSPEKRIQLITLDR